MHFILNYSVVLIISLLVKEIKVALHSVQQPKSQSQYLMFNRNPLIKLQNTKLENSNMPLLLSTTTIQYITLHTPKEW
jgi:hypothetical protein